ncbi:hypothetical protein BOTBODRAFT_76572, partial [Botryobasidium botryosum FD-172 SS1]
LSWRVRAATRAVQKIPADAPQQCRVSLLRQARVTRDYGIPASCRVNIDQTNVVLQQGSGLTYAEVGSKQVAVIGQEEKRAFTIVVGASASGEALPFQAIWQGKSKRSLPVATARGQADAAQLGLQFDYSNTSTYWSTFELMKIYISGILVPYFLRQKALHSLPPDHPCILQLDAWSVHRGAELTGWLQDTYPWIFREFVPAGCT